MEEEYEELEDIIDAHTAVLFMLEQDAAAQAANDILTFSEIEFHTVNLTGQPDLERMVRASSLGFDLPVVFINGQYFSDAYTILTAASSGELARAFDYIGVDYNAANVAAIAAANN
ncbi:hypothetical protein Q4555_00250 [Octadecabacter sp. 1_MG-2023]|uniref:hypothetical protein n=1 Tax=unclassified Octadecabacter TaxID=196158 RepID=UPI001C08D3D6|nr:MULTISPECIES: hypothetical protein [unclassified Octadecabacter]MBU2993466.1 hypothetical protein [Octadecabacter sp. B2R22]MDO6733078.1 hypothetical protein [Octadecabacter sp. 1_MG-2023]